MHQEISTSALERLVTPDDYQAQRSRIFPSPASLRWYLRVHREQLVKRVAVVRIAGRLMVDPPSFDGAVVEIASEAIR